MFSNFQISEFFRFPRGHLSEWGWSIREQEHAHINILHTKHRVWFSVWKCYRIIKQLHRCQRGKNSSVVRLCAAEKLQLGLTGEVSNGFKVRVHLNEIITYVFASWVWQRWLHKTPYEWVSLWQRGSWALDWKTDLYGIITADLHTSLPKRYVVEKLHYMSSHQVSVVFFFSSCGRWWHLTAAAAMRENPQVWGLILLLSQFLNLFSPKLFW